MGGRKDKRNSQVLHPFDAYRDFGESGGVQRSTSTRDLGKLSTREPNAFATGGGEGGHNQGSELQSSTLTGIVTVAVTPVDADLGSLVRVNRVCAEILQIFQDCDIGIKLRSEALGIRVTAM